VLSIQLRDGRCNGNSREFLISIRPEDNNNKTKHEFSYAHFEVANDEEPHSGLHRETVSGTGTFSAWNGIPMAMPMIRQYMWQFADEARVLDIFGERIQRDNLYD
jgi:hypothetical protein